jgi:hypothetical protein
LVYSKIIPQEITVKILCFSYQFQTFLKQRLTEWRNPNSFYGFLFKKQPQGTLRKTPRSLRNN